MDAVIRDMLEGIELGKPGVFEGTCIIPISYPKASEKGPEYITMKEAMDQNLIVVTEISNSGSVPELNVVNNGQIPVLMLDGEEMAGAKQNRVLNTTILLKPESETIIPVSCTERGRWAYRSPNFHESGTVMYSTSRRGKMASVHQNLECGRGAASNQQAVWGDIDHLVKEMEVEAPSSAMSDVYEQKARVLNDYVEAFKVGSNQVGLLALIDGKPVGMDLLSRKEAYKVLHVKLLKSYVLDALIRQKSGRNRPSDKDVSLQTLKKMGAQFLEKCRETTGKRHQSAGLGWDWRMSSPETLGSALVFEDTVIHSAFFQNECADSSGNTERMARFQARRHYRDR